MFDESTFELNASKTVMYRIVAAIITTLSWLLFRPNVIGRDNIPLRGPVLVAPIHRSNLDFIFTLFISPRKVFFMAKESLFTFPLVGRLLRHLGAFPVRRGTADRESLQIAEAILQRGHALVLFPEGTRKEGRRVDQLRDGAMFVAARTGATVVPVGIGGSDRALPARRVVPRPARIRIVIGAPISPPTSAGRISRSAVAAKSEELRCELEKVYWRSLETR